MKTITSSLLMNDGIPDLIIPELIRSVIPDIRFDQIPDFLFEFLVSERPIARNFYTIRYRYPKI